MAEPKDRSRAGPIEAERFVSGELGPFIEYEHGHRYGVAAQLVGGLRVLDLACGSGHGSRVLREAGAKVTALDLDRECAGRARPSVCSRAEAIPFSDGSFDAVVCFEAIEHVEVPGTIVAEIARVLRRDGFALISTPDRRIYTDRAGNQNPYHLGEVDRTEFSGLLGEHFRHVALYGQSVWAGSWIAALESDGAAPGAAERGVRVLSGPSTVAPGTTPAPWVDPKEAGLPTPLYLIALAAPKQATLRRVQKQIGKNSLLHDAHQRLLGESLAGQEEVVRRDATIAELNLHARNLTARADAAEADSRNLRALLEESEKRAERVGIHADNLERELEGRNRIAADHETHARNLEELIAGQSERLRELEKHVRNTEEVCSQSREHAASLETHTRNLESELAGRSAHAENLEQQLAGLQAHVENLERGAAEYRERIQGLEQEIAARGRRADSLEHQLAAGSAHAGHLEQELAGLQAQVENLEREAAEQRERTQGLEQEIAASNERGAQLEAELGEARQQLDWIRSRWWYRSLRVLRATD